MQQRFHFTLKLQIAEEFKEQLVTVIRLAFIHGCSKQHWLVPLHTPPCGVFVCLECSCSVCTVCVFVCASVVHLRFFFIPHGSTFSNIAPAGPSLKVVNEHRHAVGSHQVVGISGERLVLPAFWVTWGQTDGVEGGWVSDNSCFFCKIPAVKHFTSTHPLKPLHNKVTNRCGHYKTVLSAELDRIHRQSRVTAHVCGLFPSTTAQETSKSYSALFYWMSPACCWPQITARSLRSLSARAIINTGLCQGESSSNQ